MYEFSEAVELAFMLRNCPRHSYYRISKTAELLSRFRREALAVPSKKKLRELTGACSLAFMRGMWGYISAVGCRCGQEARTPSSAHP
jgi:hypothetical protein